LKQGKQPVTNQERYFSYLLRLWRSDGRNESAWRASLENPHTGERLGFDSLEQLFAFLDGQITPGTGNAPANRDQP
jgi:hypothetical protein